MGYRSKIDPNGLLEFSVVYTNRALNHMSRKFQKAMRNLNEGMCECYGADKLIVVPGSGTFGMEAVARQLCKGKKVMTLRNGFFNYRWTQIFEQGGLAAEEKSLLAKRSGDGDQAKYEPHPINDVAAQIKAFKPDVVCATHVETSAGIKLSDEYIKQAAQAAHEAGALFVLDCIASGCSWVDMKETGVDVITAAPQKGWSPAPCCGLVLINERAEQAIKESQSDSFALDLKKWLAIMQAYLDGGHAYHCTMPTNSLLQLAQTVAEAQEIGFGKLKRKQEKLGKKALALLEENGFPSIAAKDCQAPSVLVCYTKDKDIQSGKAFAEAGMQVASGVPLKCDEPSGFMTFRLGLFGVDKLLSIDEFLEDLKEGLEEVCDR